VEPARPHTARQFLITTTAAMMQLGAGCCAAARTREGAPLNTETQLGKLWLCQERTPHGKKWFCYGNKN